MAVPIEKAVAEKVPIVIMGDFNCDMLLQDSKSQRLEEVRMDYVFVQMVREPTTVTQTSETQVDLLFATDGNDIGVVLDQVGCVELGLSDCSLMYGVVNKRKVNTLRMVHCFGKCNLEKLVVDLDASPWQVMDTFDGMDSKWDCWKMFFWKIVDSCAPLKKARVSTKTVPWITQELSVLMKARNYHCKKLRKVAMRKTGIVTKS